MTEHGKITGASLHQLKARPEDLLSFCFQILYVFLWKAKYIACPFQALLKKQTQFTLHISNHRNKLLPGALFSFGAYTLLLVNLSRGFTIAFLDNPVRNSHHTSRTQKSRNSVAALYIPCQSQNGSSVSVQPGMINTSLLFSTETLTLPSTSFPHPSSSWDG